MKRYILILATICVASFSYGQTITDALRYSQSNITGTARFNGLGGAFGALGGDLSAIGINPAGSAVFKGSTATFTLAVDNVDNNTSFFGSSNTTSESDISFNQGGAVFVYEAHPETTSKWKKLSLGVNFDRTANFDDDFVARGIGNTSIANYFLEFAQGVPLDLLELQPDETVSSLYQFLGETEGFGAQQAFLGFQSFIIDPVDFDDVNNTAYVSTIAGSQFDQEFNFDSRGFNGKIAFNIGGQYDENFYFGLNLNSHFFDYDQSTLFFENNDNPDSLVRSVRFENELRTQGAGFSAQIGTIIKVTDNLRLGLTYDTPTWYDVEEETLQRIQTVSEDVDGVFTTSINPRIVNIFEDYTLQTPSRYAGSIAYLFGKQGLLSFDYAYTDYQNIRFRPSGDPFFSTQNSIISNSLQGASSFKIGGEYRIDNDWSLRGGYRYEESPYEDGETIGDRTGFSAGFGYSWGYIKFDMAYDYTTQDRNQELFTTGLTSTTAIEADTSTVSASVTFVLN